MAAPQHVDRQTFLSNLRESGLVSEEQLERELERLPSSNRGRLLARALVQSGHLTRFQAERLLAGRTTGFRLGQYLILDQIGRGGMGRVYKAEHRTMRRTVAIKVLAPHLLRTSRAQELFLREVHAVSRLVHPNIVTAFDANENGGRHFLVLEYVDGPNLDQLVRKQGPLAVAQACEYVRQVALGLQCAYHIGMVHRDIKPANLLVQRRAADGDESSPGLLKISDFGLARLHHPDDHTDTAQAMGTILVKENTVMGTPDFLSPEQGRNLHDVDIRSDLYSLGCTFFFLLTGQVPFPGGSTLDKLIRHSTTPPRPVKELRPDVPDAVAAILDKLMRKAPEERYQTPAELSNALQPFAVTGAIPWAPPPPPSSPFLDSLATPSSDGTLDVLPDEEEEVSDADQLAGLANTATSDSSTTPLVTPSFHFPAPKAQSWRPAAIAVLASAGAVLTLIAILQLLIGG